MSAQVEHIGDIIRTRRAHVTTLDVRRAAQLNTIDMAAIAAFEGHLSAIEADDACVAVILTSEGTRSFVAGGDLRAFQDLTDEASAHAMSTRMGDVLRRLERLPALVVAAVQGFAFGGGCEMLAACDLVIAHPTSTLAYAQVRFALTPGWGGGARLVRRVGRARALELMLTGRRLSADEALSLGLVDQLHDQPREAAESLAAELPRDRALVDAIKRVATPPSELAWDACLDRERAIFVERWVSPEHERAVAAFFAPN